MVELDVGIGIMQGRLLPDRYDAIQSFPGIRWAEEFSLASQLGLSHIEWIYEKRNRNENPLVTTEGIKKIKQLIHSTGVGVQSICADYFMECPYLKASRTDRMVLSEHLLWLVEQAHLLGANYIDLPFVDNSSIPGVADFADVVEFLKPASKRADELGVTIALETDLPPEDFRRLLDMVLNLGIGANYDSGNSSGIGYEFFKELSLYGDSICTVHLKDKKKGGATLPLGTGYVDFSALFKGLHSTEYSGPIVLQAARGEGSEMDTVRQYMKYISDIFTELKYD